MSRRLRRELGTADGSGIQLHTFSVVGRCPRTEMLGVAVSTAVPAVGGLCPYASARVGAVATQSWVNPYLALDALNLLRQGLTAPEALRSVLESDPGADLRQIGIVDSSGNSAAHSGRGCTGWFGQVLGTNYAIQGNMLVGPSTLDAMARSFESSPDDPLTDRLMACLEAGQKAGGDKRGRQSAALLTVDREEYAYLDLRVDEHTDPVGELRRIYEIAKVQVIPFVQMMPTRADPGRELAGPVVDLLLTPPAERPTHA